MKRKVYKLDYGFKAYECENFYDLDFLKFKPAKLGQQKLKKELGKTIKLVVIDASVWTKLVAFWKKRLISLSYGFYEPKSDSIFVNIKTCGVSADKDCHLTKPTDAVLRRLSEVVTHEYIHYTFQKKTDQVISRLGSQLKLFYKTLWSGVVDDNLLPYISRAHYMIAITTNKNILDPLLGKITQLQLDRFVRILQNLKENYPHRILRKQTFADIIETMTSLLSGSLVVSDFVTAQILKAYKAITETYPPMYLQVCQELVFASEVLSVCANIKSSKAEQIVRQILSLQ